MSENELKACVVCGELRRPGQLSLLMPGVCYPCTNPTKQQQELTQLKQQLEDLAKFLRTNYPDLCSVESFPVLRAIGQLREFHQQVTELELQLAAKTEELERVQTQVEKMRNALLEVQYGGDDECIACGRCVCCSNDCVISNALSPNTPTTEQSSADGGAHA